MGELLKARAEGNELTKLSAQRLHYVLELEYLQLHTRKRTHLPLISVWE